MSGIDMIYTEAAGTNCTIAGMRGVVKLITFRPDGYREGAFIHLDNSNVVLFAHCGERAGEREAWSEVSAWYPVTRDDFDRITGLAQARRDMGWPS